MSNMRFKAKPIQVHDRNPFEEDALSRAECADHLTTFVSLVMEPLVMAINSPFGTGKSTFLKMWIQQLKNSGYTCLNFNSWENDFSDSPLVSLIGEISAGIEQLKLRQSESNRVHELMEKTKQSGAALIKAVLPTAVKIATSGILDLDKIVEADISKLAEELAKKQIEKYQADKKTIAKFREDLKALVATLSQTESGTIKKPVVFVIDELDRCRPLYAIELLEKIKHLFSVEGLIFVLAIDRKQLGESVRCLYGSGLDADGYLRRFIDLEYRLPTPDLAKFVENQIVRFELAERYQQLRADDFNTLKTYLRELPKLFAVSLRTQEQCFTRLSIVLRTIPPKHSILAPLLVFFIYLRDANHELYDDIVSGKFGPVEVIQYLRTLKDGIFFLGSQNGIHLEAYLTFADANTTRRESALEKLYRRSEAGVASNPPDTRTRQIARQISLITDVDCSSDRIMEFLHKRIEMAAKFLPLENTAAS